MSILQPDPQNGYNAYIGQFHSTAADQDAGYGQECAALPKKLLGLPQTSEWKAGAWLNDQNGPQIGQGVATFYNPDTNKPDTYYSKGHDYSHSGIITQKYPDGSIDLLEQFNGNPAHIRHINDMNGITSRPQDNARNYRAITTAQGAQPIMEQPNNVDTENQKLLADLQGKTSIKASPNNVTTSNNDIDTENQKLLADLQAKTGQQAIITSNKNVVVPNTLNGKPTTTNSDGTFSYTGEKAPISSPTDAYTIPPTTLVDGQTSTPPNTNIDPTKIGQAMQQGYDNAPMLLKPIAGPYRGAQEAISQGITALTGSPNAGRDIVSMPDAYMGSPNSLRNPLKDIQTTQVNQIAQAGKNAIATKAAYDTSPAGIRDAEIAAANQANDTAINAHQTQMAAKVDPKSTATAVSTILDTKKTAIPENDVMSVLRQANNATRTAVGVDKSTRSSIDAVINAIGNKEDGYISKPDELYGVRNVINDQIAKQTKSTGANSDAAVVQLKGIRNQIDNVLEKNIPGAKVALDAHQGALDAPDITPPQLQNVPFPITNPVGPPQPATTAQKIWSTTKTVAPSLALMGLETALTGGPKYSLAAPAIAAIRHIYNTHNKLHN